MAVQEAVAASTLGVCVRACVETSHGVNAKKAGSVVVGPTGRVGGIRWVEVVVVHIGIVYVSCQNRNDEQQNAHNDQDP